MKYLFLLFCCFCGFVVVFCGVFLGGWGGGVNYNKDERTKVKYLLSKYIETHQLLPSEAIRDGALRPLYVCTILNVVNCILESETCILLVSRT